MLLRECNLCYDYDPPAPSHSPSCSSRGSWRRCGGQPSLIVLTSQLRLELGHPSLRCLPWFRHHVRVPHNHSFSLYGRVPIPRLSRASSSVIWQVCRLQAGRLVGAGRWAGRAGGQARSWGSRSFRMILIRFRFSLFRRQVRGRRPEGRRRRGCRREGRREGCSRACGHWSTARDFAAGGKAMTHSLGILFHLDS